MSPTNHQDVRMPLPQLRRVRWAVRATLTLGVAASVAANILHARPNPISQIIAAWPPLALLLTVELISRIPVHRRSLAAVRLASTATIAGIAAWVSYWHMVGVAAHYGETGLSPYLLPLSVDGLVIVASVSLVELAGRIRADETVVAETAVVETAVGQTAVGQTAVAGTAAAAIPDSATVVARPVYASPVQAPAGATWTPEAPAGATDAAPAPAGATEPETTATATRPRRAPARRASPARDEKAAPAKAAPRRARPATDGAAGAKDAPAGISPSVAELAMRAARMKADQPNLTQAAIAAQLGITTHRLRQINRQAVAA
jgi:hypothetical protein